MRQTRFLLWNLRFPYASLRSEGESVVVGSCVCTYFLLPVLRGVKRARLAVQDQPSPSKPVIPGRFHYNMEGNGRLLELDKKWWAVPGTGLEALLEPICSLYAWHCLDDTIALCAG